MPEFIEEGLDSLQPAKCKVGMVLGLPMARPNVRREWAHAMMTMAWPMNYSIMHTVVTDRPISDARNLICEQALEVESPYVLFIDDDTVPPSAAVRMLLYHLEQHPEAIAIGGIYCCKTEPTQPMVFKEWGQGSHWDWAVGEVFPVVGIGTGCMLLRTNLLKTIEKPWFRTIDVAPTDGEKFKVQLTDDLYFCQKAQKAGHTILAHGGVICDHWDINTGKVYRLPKDSRPYKLREELDSGSSKNQRF